VSASGALEHFSQPWLPVFRGRPGQAKALLSFAHHEARLAWRDWLAMMGGRRRRTGTIAIAVIVFVICMHAVAYSVAGGFADVGLHPDKTTLVMMTGSLLLSGSLMLSQAMESVTRAFYARSDLELILTSPAPLRSLFAVRIATMALTMVLMGALLAAPFINVLAARGGLRWLGAYGVVAAMGFFATALAVALTIALLRSVGPTRTRWLAQVVAAVIGAIFIIGLQAAAILSYNTLSRFDILRSDRLVALAPNADSILYWPARALIGDAVALAGVMGFSIAALALAIALFSPRFGDYALAAAGAVGVGARRRGLVAGFRTVSAACALRRKESMLLRRDPWLMSQTLMQILYLLPPALLLWKSLGENGTLLVVVPVLVMAAGQLAGGLAWLAISGEDAPDLVATAPVAAATLLRAKIEAVVGAIALIFLPFIATLAALSPFHAGVATLGIAIAAASATQIQLWFRRQAKRSQFRRRQVSSRMATFAEAFSSIIWAATAALASAGSSLALIMAAIAVGVLLAARAISPR
jgi:ABC-2 type transport system permease protein